MLNRRSFISVGSALAALLPMLAGAGRAHAKSGKLPVEYDPRGAVGRLERLPLLDLESRQDFMAGVTAFSTTGELAQAARAAGRSRPAQARASRCHDQGQRSPWRRRKCP